MSGGKAERVPGCITWNNRYSICSLHARPIHSRKSPNRLLKNYCASRSWGLHPLQGASALASADCFAGGQHAVRIPRYTSAYHSYACAPRPQSRPARYVFQQSAKLCGTISAVSPLIRHVDYQSGLAS